MIDTDKYKGHTPTPWKGILSGYFTIEQLDKTDKVLMQDAPLLLAEVLRLREVILDFSLPMWNYLNSQVHPDHEEFTANAVKSLVMHTPYKSLMHLWEDACGYLPDPDCDDAPRNKPVWNRELIE